MKKFMAMLLALVMALSLVACGQKADDTAKDDANTDNTDDSLVVLENVVDWGETEPYRVLVQKGDPKGLLEGINKAIAELTANDGALIKEIEDKVASQDTYMPRLLFPLTWPPRPPMIPPPATSPFWSWAPAPTIPPMSSSQMLL